MITKERFAPNPLTAIFASGTSSRLDDLAETSNADAEVSESPIVKGIGIVGVFSVPARSGIAVIVGGSLAGITVNRNESVSVAPSSSVTVRVIVADPVWSGAGVTVTVRLLPVPLMTMFASGTSVGFEEAPETTSALANDSASETLKSIAGVDERRCDDQ